MQSMVFNILFMTDPAVSQAEMNTLIKKESGG